MGQTDEKTRLQNGGQFFSEYGIYKLAAPQHNTSDEQFLQEI